MCIYVDLYKIDIPVHVDLLDLYSPSPVISISILGLRSQNAYMYMERKNLHEKKKTSLACLRVIC